MNKDTHENLLQTLSALLLEIHALQTLLPLVSLSQPELADIAMDTNALSTGLNELEHLATRALTTVRSSLEEFPMLELEGVPLSEALFRMVEDTAERLSLTSRISFSGADEQNKAPEQNLSPGRKHLLYLVARESLCQVEQHQGARRLRFGLTYNQDDVQMSLEDDGVNDFNNENQDEEQGVDAPAPPFERTSTAPSEAALKPIIDDLRARLHQLGGSLEIVPAGERGTRVVVRLPYISTETSDASKASEDHDNGRALTSIKENNENVDPSTQPEADRPVRVLVVESQAVTRAGLRRLLESYADLQVIGEAADGVQAVSETLELGPQVVLIDTQLPSGQSLEALRQIKQLNLDAKVLLLATQDREEYMYETLRAGADGYVLKDIAPDELAQAVRAVARGEVTIQSQLAGRLLSRFGRQGRYDVLTVRELDVLRLLARGMRNKEIAARLFVSERTVNFHLANIYQKLNVSGRTEALSKAIEQGLVTP
ncbi:MAG: response regulator [Ktedonobacteraceae bacterium]|nr:response regulator [Ktedonobacteraceae bacterium]